MKISADPSIHRHREEQIIQHVEKLLADERLRIDTIQGRRPVTAFVRDVARDDGALNLKRLMTELNVPDRELQGRMPVGKTLDITLTQTRWLFFTQTVGRIKVLCVSPNRQLILGEEPKEMSGGEVIKLLASMPPPLNKVPQTIVLVSTGGFTMEARELAERRADRTVLLVEPNDAGGWTAIGPAETKAVADLFDPEAEEQKRQRILDLIEESKMDLLGSGIATDKLAGKAQLPIQLVEAIVKDYAKQAPGLSAKRLDGRVVLFREGSGALQSGLTADSGGSMGLIDKVRTLFGRKGETGKKIAFLSERKTALSQQRDRAYEDMGALEAQESELKQQFKDAPSAITKRRITGQMLQLRKDLERRQQLLSVLNQQINVVSTHLHNLELVQQGQTAKLPDTDEITEDAVKAEEMLAQLEADSELAGTVGQVSNPGMSAEEQALYAELENENSGVGLTSEPVEEEKPEPKAQEKPAREPAAKTPVVPEARKEPAAAPARRAEPEAGENHPMALIDKIFGHKKTLSELDRQELRKEEIILTKQRDRLFKRIEQISTDKQKIFQQGATQKSPELRKALAQDFELKTQEQLMAARELNLRSKELLTVSRLRMVKENTERGRAMGRLNLTGKDVAKISQWIEDDAVTQDVYVERLNEILDLGAQSDKDALANAGLSGAGQELMNIWNEMDRGGLKQDEGFQEADKAVRRRNTSMEKEQ